jgi:HPt (histidine-containing phosphotransfer) domain-containing protein
MRTATTSGDASALAHEAHTLASSCNSFGLQRAGKALLHTEVQLKESPQTALEPLLDELEDLLGQSLEALASARVTQPSI